MERYKKVTCNVCLQQIGTNNIRKHISKCKKTTCPHCNKEFIAKQNTLFCSRSCANSNSVKTNGKTRAGDLVYTYEQLLNIYTYYLKHSLRECLTEFGLSTTVSLLKKRFIKFGFTVRSKQEDSILFRSQGKYKKQTKINKICTKAYWTAERRAAHSKKMKQVVAENPESYALKPSFTRVKTYRVPNHTGDLIKLRGTYELSFATYLNEQHVKWDKVLDSFSYVWENNTHQYYPDFYLPDLDIFVEIKGRVTQRDIEKSKQFSKPLLYLFQAEIKSINKGNYDIKTELLELAKSTYKTDIISRLELCKR